jgi:hypothetical protein
MASIRLVSGRTPAPGKRAATTPASQRLAHESRAAAATKALDVESPLSPISGSKPAAAEAMRSTSATESVARHMTLADGEIGERAVLKLHRRLRFAAVLAGG